MGGYAGLTREEMERAALLAGGGRQPIMLDPVTVQARGQQQIMADPMLAPSQAEPWMNSIAASLAGESLGEPVRPARLPVRPPLLRAVDPATGQVSFEGADTPESREYIQSRGMRALETPLPGGPDGGPLNAPPTGGGGPSSSMEVGPIQLGGNPDAAMYKRLGALEPGNVDLRNRPYVKNGNSVSTINSMGFQDDKGGPEILIPTVSDDGRLMSGDEAIDYYHETGKHLGKYPTVEASNAAGEALHQDQVARPPVNSLAERLPANPYPEERDPTTPAEIFQQLFGDEVALSEQKGQAQARGQDREASLRAAAGEYLGKRFADVNQRVDASRARRDELKAAINANLAAGQRALGEAPSTTKSEIMGLVGSVLAAAGKPVGATLARGMGNIMSRDYQRWQMGLAGYETQHKMLNALAKSESEGAASDLHEEQALSTLLAAQMTNGLEQIRSETKSEETKSLIDVGIVEIKKKYMDHSLDVAQRVAQMSWDQEAHQMSREDQGMQRQAHRLNQERGAFDLTKSRETEARAPQMAQIPGLRIEGDPRTITAPQKTEAVKLLAEQRSVYAQAEAMKKYGAIFTPDAAREYEIARTGLIGTLNKREANAGVVNEGEASRWDKRIPSHLGAVASSAFRDKIYNSKWTMNLDNVLESATARSEELTRLHLDSLGYKPESADSLRAVQPGLPAARASGELRTRGRDGKETVVPDSPENRALAAKLGQQILE
jgi:hypothetical protein